jgi:hypothetical protein
MTAATHAHPHQRTAERVRAASPFRSPEEFREVIDRILTMMSEDPDMGPQLREADVRQRFEFEDFQMVVNVRAARPGEPANLQWQWADQVEWSPKLHMTMSSTTANRYFQGRENVVYAIARRRIKTGGEIKAALELVPITKPLGERYRALVAAEYPHLSVR